jgi:mRNA interferase MazF
MVKGDIILVPFPFTNLSGSKIRPACVLILSASDVTIAFITTQFNWVDEACLEIISSNENGLKKTSLIRLNKIASIDKALVLGKIGKLNSNDIGRIDSKLKEILQLT